MSLSVSNGRVKSPSIAFRRSIRALHWAIRCTVVSSSSWQRGQPESCGKSWSLKFKFSRPVKSWKIDINGPGKLRKTTFSVLYASGIIVVIICVTVIVECDHNNEHWLLFVRVSVKVVVWLQSGADHWWLGSDGLPGRQWLHTSPASPSHPPGLSATALANLQDRPSNTWWSVLIPLLVYLLIIYE